MSECWDDSVVQRYLFTEDWLEDRELDHMAGCKSCQDVLMSEYPTDTWRSYIRNLILAVGSGSG